jgi:hypothetical protein
MPFVSGFLKVRSGGHPDQGLPGGEGPVDPGYGVDAGEGPSHPIELPDPPPGIWPPLTPEAPWRPIDPGYGVGGRPPHVSTGPVRPGAPERPSTGPVPPGRPPAAPDQGLPGQPAAPDQGLPAEPPTAGHLPALPPGTIWPPLPPGVTGHYLALMAIRGPGGQWQGRYVVVDADARPSHPIAPGGPQPK